MTTFDTQGGMAETFYDEPGTGVQVTGHPLLKHWTSSLADGGERRIPPPLLTVSRPR